MPALSEMQSRERLAVHGIPFNRAILADNIAEAVAAAKTLGFPVALKGDHPEVAHKSDSGLVRLNLGSAEALQEAAMEMLRALPLGGKLSVQEMVSGDLEFAIGFFRDEVFGPCISVGLGGIFAEAYSDAVFRRLPVTEDDMVAALGDLGNQNLLGALRGKPAVDRAALAAAALGLARAVEADETITEIDVNPLLIVQGKPIAVDALIVKRGDPT